MGRYSNSGFVESQRVKVIKILRYSPSFLEPLNRWQNDRGPGRVVVHALRCARWGVARAAQKSRVNEGR
jgi:hypothetical protein